MSSPTPIDPVLRAALALGAAGFRVFPCRPHDRRPAVMHWDEVASDSERQIRIWFARGDYNVAVACGPQPGGVNLVAVDIDPPNGGDVTWAELADVFEIPPTATHQTPSGGQHLFFDAPIALHNGRLGVGIDTRGEGGYVIVPPSTAPSKATGEILPYTWNRSSSLVTAPVAPMPTWMVANLEPEPLVASVGRHPSQLPGTTPADRLRQVWKWELELEGDGWTLDRRHGEASEWTRPGKDPRQGTSATLHDGGPLNVYSTSLPAGGVAGRGDVRSYSPWDYCETFRFPGDRRTLLRYIDEVAPLSPTPAVVALAAADRDRPAGDEEPAGLNLAAGLWDERPQLAHIRSAAQAAGCSPDALLIHALARTATFIHPCYKLPGVEQGLIGKPQTLDFLGCVVAETSGGKTLAAGVGEMLIPQPDPPDDGSDPLIDFEQRVGSGEGIAEFFLVPERVPDDDGKLVLTGRRVIGRQALFMSVDEGTGFTNQAGRKGTTIIATLASAWSGESLGQLNAASETRRLVRGGRVRVCAVINMQDSNGYKLYTDELESVGFTGRLLFATAHDPAAPDLGTEPDWPGPLEWPIWAGSETTQFYTYEPAIATEIRTTRHGILTREVEIDRRQSQYLLLRCKTAAILATWEGRSNVTVSDWALATQIVASSVAVLGHLDAVHRSQLESRAVGEAERQLAVSSQAETRHLAKLAIGWRARVLERLAKEGPLPWKRLRDVVRSEHRETFRAVLDELVESGVLSINDERYECSS